MRLELNINMDNAAFEDDPFIELKRIFLHIARKFEKGECPLNVYDINGNIIGDVIIYN